jgi:hypothetical protein
VPFFVYKIAAISIMWGIPMKRPLPSRRYPPSQNGFFPLFLQGHRKPRL